MEEGEGAAWPMVVEALQVGKEVVMGKAFVGVGLGVFGRVGLGREVVGLALEEEEGAVWPMVAVALQVEKVVVTGKASVGEGLGVFGMEGLELGAFEMGEEG